MKTINTSLFVRRAVIFFAAIIAGASVAIFVMRQPAPVSATEEYAVVIANGRVMDPESGLDATRNVGITGGKIRAISAEPLQGKKTIDAMDLTVAPGFIDLHQHGQEARNY